MKKFLFLGVFLLVLASLLPASVAATLVPCGATQDDPATKKIDESTPCQFCHSFKLIENIIEFFLIPDPDGPNNGVAVVPLLATLLILVGGFYILIAAGRPDMQTKGKSIITAVVIGLLVVYIAWIVVNSILSFLGVAEWTGLLQWWDIKCG